MKNSSNQVGTLFIVATPIGNLKDITLRAIEILKTVNLIACEDTRVTVKLLNHFGISKPLFAVHQHSKDSRTDYLIKELKRGSSIAMVSDSGTPGISDPGAYLVNKAVNAKIKIVPIPGPSALTAALSAAGLVSKGIIFLGFLPQKKGRHKKLNEIPKYVQDGLIVVFYESPHRIKKSLRELTSLSDELEITCFREISKKFEEIIYLKQPIIQEQIENIMGKGEFTIVIS